MEKAGNRGADVFLLIISVFIIVSIAVSWNQYYVKRDFKVYAKIPCEAASESCFVEECETSDPRCNEGGTMKYKVLFKPAKEIPPLSCNDDNCEIIMCSEESLSDLELDAVCSTDK